MRYTITCCFCCLFLVLGCDEELAEPLTTADGAVFYPLELNRPLFYAVDSIVLFNEVSGVRYDTARLEARETLVETFLDAEGREWYRGERWERSGEDAPWRFRQTYAVSADDAGLLRREDNLTFRKLVFPLRQGLRWDGNTDFDEDRNFVVGGEFMMVYKFWEYEVTALAPGETVTIRQAEEDNLIDYRDAYEVYRAGTGLTERFIDARSTQCVVCCDRDTGSCRDLPWDEKAEKGFILHQRLIPN